MKNKKYIRRVLTLTPFFLLTVACGNNGGGQTAGNIAPPFGDIIEDVPEAPKPADPLPENLLAEVLAQGVPEKAATLAFNRYDQWRSRIRNGKYISVIDFTKHSGRARLFVIEIATGKVDAIHVAHASKSDPNDDGMATVFGNVPDSRKSSLGAYVVGEKYYGKYGASMKLDGLENSNSMVRARSIVMHPSNYVSANRSKQGRSWGCPAVPFAWIGKLIDRLRDGSFMFAYSNVAATSNFDRAAIDQIMLNPAYRWVNEAEEAPIDGE